jgi:hypothetical protein
VRPGARATACVLFLVAACSRGAPDATPEGVVRLWIEKMESASDDPHATRDAYELMGPLAKKNLEQRAERASRGQGRRFEPWEMLAEGRFGLKFRPKTMSGHVEGDDATVEVRGERPEEQASVRVARTPAGWRVEPELPPVRAPARRDDGGT